MDVATRSLREGAVDSAPVPLLLLEDTLDTVGGQAILLKAVAELASSIAQGRAQAQAITIIALIRPPVEYQCACQALLLPGQLSIMDCFTDPYGWQALLGAQHAPSIPPSTTVSLARGILQQPDGLSQLLCLAGAAPGCEAGGPGSGQCRTPVSHSNCSQPQGQQQPSMLPAPAPHHCIVVDSLSPLLDCYGVRAVCQWLHLVQRSPATSCMLCGLHADLHPPEALTSLRYLATGLVQLQPVSDLERALCAAPATAAVGGVSGGTSGARSPHGRVAVRLKRRAGRVRAEAQLYRVEGGQGGGVAYWDAPAVVPTPQALLAESAVGAADGPSAPSSSSASRPTPAAAGAGGSGGLGEGGSALALQMEGGMKLSLSVEEEAARRRVQLPYEHQGGGAAYQTGDYRDYLPPSAGGHGGGGRRLGHILYVRDSASEHDSDEDPDDDLDL